MSGYMVMAATASDTIGADGATWAAADTTPSWWSLDGPPNGRYIRLQFTVPESNGADIEKLLIARDEGGANPSDYVLCCPENAAASPAPPPCTSSTGIKWWSVVGESDETQRCTPGMTVNVWIGCTHPTQQQSPAKTSGVCGTGDALTPQTTYTWSSED